MRPSIKHCHHVQLLIETYSDIDNKTVEHDVLEILEDQLWRQDFNYYISVSLFKEV